MTSTLKPDAPIWTPGQSSHPLRIDFKPSKPSAPTTPFGSAAASFTPKHHPFYNSFICTSQDVPISSGFYAPQDCYYLLSPYQEWPAAPWAGQYVHANDPFARQLHQLESLRVSEYYPAAEGKKKGGKKGSGGKKKWERRSKVVEKEREKEREAKKCSDVRKDSKIMDEGGIKK